MTTNKTILTIDDDVAITELLSIILRAHGFEALTANNSEDGLRLISEKCPDAVTLDLMMPEISGLEMCRRIRAITRAPVLVLSAINDPAMVAAVLDSGADDFIVKPVPSAVLVAHLNTLMRRSAVGGNLKQPDNPQWVPGSAPLSS
ncbi:MAG TPA: response regulator transcription factor [Anaerolineales bacterium]|nr:response regulator transcription factor [Anaerolineales bacterium]